MRQEGQSWLTPGVPRQALGFFAAAIAVEPANSANWAGFASAALAVNPGNDWQERYKLQEREVVAAYTAYLRATNPADEASALALLGRT